MTLKDKLKQAEIQPGYEYHESVEDALGQLPRRPMKRPAPRTAKLAGTIAAVLLILAIPMCIPGARATLLGMAQQFMQPTDPVDDHFGGSIDPENGDDGNAAFLAPTPPTTPLAELDTPMLNDLPEEEDAFLVPDPTIPPNELAMHLFDGEQDQSSQALPLGEDAIIPREEAVPTPLPIPDFRITFEQMRFEENFEENMVYMDVRIVGKNLVLSEQDPLWLSEWMIDQQYISAPTRPYEMEKVQGGYIVRYAYPLIQDNNIYNHRIYCVLDGPGGIHMERVFKYNNIRKVTFFEDDEKALRDVRAQLDESVSCYRLLGTTDKHAGVQLMIDSVYLYEKGLSIRLLADPAEQLKSMTMTDISLENADGSALLEGDLDYELSGKGGSDWPLNRHEDEGELRSFLFELPYYPTGTVKDGDTIQISCRIRMQDLNGNMMDAGPFSVSAQLNKQYLSDPSDDWLDDATFVVDTDDPAASSEAQSTPAPYDTDNDDDWYDDEIWDDDADAPETSN